MAMKTSNTVPLIILCAFLFPMIVWCQSAGQISGKVVDVSTNEALISANVMLVGTSLGSPTNVDGEFVIRNVPPGTYALRVSYIGYKSQEVQVRVTVNAGVRHDFKLEPVAIQGQEVVVTAQAVGQNAAIQQQLASDKIVNIVSSAKIQQLPDANAAESVGRLPGVSLVRTGGEATGVVIRGLQPKYVQILIDGVEMAATNDDNRSTDLSAISPNMLSGIEVYKTVTPDMDAAVLGGVVNFKIKEAEKSIADVPNVGLQMQGGYNDLVTAYNNYKFVATVEDRYLDGKFGVFLQGIAERVNRTSDELGGGFQITNGAKLTGVHQTYMTGINIHFIPRQKERYDGTLVLDYQLPEGKIDFMNTYSRTNQAVTDYNQNYGLDGNSIYFKDTYSYTMITQVTNILDYKQTVGPISLDAKASHSFSDNKTPTNWDFNFWQNAAGITGIDNQQSPVDIARQVHQIMDLTDMFVYQPHLKTNYSKQQDFTGSLDLKTIVNISDVMSATISAGGQYRYTGRAHTESNVNGTLWNPGDAKLRAAILATFPWMTQAPYNLNPNGGAQIPIAPFIDPKFNYGKFLRGDYTMGPGTNVDMIYRAILAVVDSSRVNNWNTDVHPDNQALISNNYSGHENRSAAYLMATINIGPQITITPGVRYQGLQTVYTAPRIYNPNFKTGYPAVYPHFDTTLTRYHGYWLPDVSVRYKPLPWFDVRLAYTSTLSYPDFSYITPLIVIGTSSITWHNADLAPTRSQNYDLAFSVYNNTVGLFTAGGFLKQIDGMMFSTGDRYPKDFKAFSGIPSPLPAVIQYSINYTINDPYRTNVWGIEAEWQTHFWYLPKPFDGLVLNANYTHLFSGAKYPFTYNYQTGYPPKVVYVDTFYTDRLYQQAKDIANLSVGYDYKGFSVLVSMIYQSNIFNSNNFWPELRVFKDNYLKWDLFAKQQLPWFGVEMYLDVNNINKESDVYLIQGPGFPSSAQDYGLTADIGLRWKL